MRVSTSVVLRDGGSLKRARAFGICAALLAMLVLSLGCTNALAAEVHVFDPGLSLEGACAGNDGVKDPGCPYKTPAEGGPKPLKNPCGTAVDRAGDTYVANTAPAFGEKPETWVDVFAPNGLFLTKLEVARQLCGLAVDSEGNLYAADHDTGDGILYRPDAYPPVAGTTYTEAATPFYEETVQCTEANSVAVDPSNDHVYVATHCGILEYDSEADGLALITEGIGAGLGGEFVGVDVYGANHDVYATGTSLKVDGSERPFAARLFVFDGTDGHAKCEIDGSERPGGGFGFVFGRASVAVDQSNGDAYVGDIGAHQVVDQFDDTCHYVGQIPAQSNNPPLTEPEPYGDIAVDDPIVEGEAGYQSPNAGDLYVASGKSSNSHLYAFAPGVAPRPPEVEAQRASAIGEAEALLEAKVNPEGLATSYHFEYTTEADFEAHGYAGASSKPAPDAVTSALGSFVRVSTVIGGLEPGVAYRFRLVASNHCLTGEPEVTCVTSGQGKPGEEGVDARFVTYPQPPLAAPCVNQQLLVGPSARLPNCRAYELVTPAETNGRIPTLAALGEAVDGFDTNPATSDGNGLAFGTEGGSLPALGGSGYDDLYEARRDPASGWRSVLAGTTGIEAQQSLPGGISPDHANSFWEVRGENGSLATGAAAGVNYIRRPAGVLDPGCSAPKDPTAPFELIGCGSLGVDTHAEGRWITSGAGHVVFVTRTRTAVSPVQLESNAPPSGTDAVYDRTADGVTHVVSLLPGDVALKAGEPAAYQGVSANGSTAAFKVKGTLYVRLGNTETQMVSGGETVFGGLSRDGGRLFYLSVSKAPKAGEIPQGNIFSYDTASKTTTPVGSGGESILVNVSPDGSHAYFVSRKQLDEAKEGQVGAENLYVWDGSAVRFVTAVAPEDVTGREGVPASGQERVGGLGQWVTDVVNPQPGRTTGGPAPDPSRTTPDGRVLVFESRADFVNLNPGYDSGGHAEIYRYGAGQGPGEGLSCLSCNSTGAAAGSDAELESGVGIQLRFGPPVNALTHIANVTNDGKAVFFQSADRLVAADSDGLIDVYEWQAQGAGGCQVVGGCVSLISSGHSAGNDYLYAMTPDGHDVFFASSDLLTAQDSDPTPSIYDARVAGGFVPEPVSTPCQGDACQQGERAPPPPASPASATLRGPGNGTTENSRCPHGKRKVRRAGKVRCVGKSSHRRQSKKGNAR